MYHKQNIGADFTYSLVNKLATVFRGPLSDFINVHLQKGKKEEKTRPYLLYEYLACLNNYYPLNIF